ncbi:hypothetical protein ACLOJK_004215, partial [Asimina triloba]
MAGVGVRAFGRSKRRCDLVFLTSVVGSAIIRRRQRHPLPFPFPVPFLVPPLDPLSSPSAAPPISHLPSISAAPPVSHCPFDLPPQRCHRPPAVSPFRSFILPSRPLISIHLHRLLLPTSTSTTRLAVSQSFAVSHLPGHLSSFPFFSLSAYCKAKASSTSASPPARLAVSLLRLGLVGTRQAHRQPASAPASSAPSRLAVSLQAKPSACSALPLPSRRPPGSP